MQTRRAYGQFGMLLWVAMSSGLASCASDNDHCDDSGCHEAESESNGTSEESVCRFSHECGAGRACLNGACQAECDADTMCPEGQGCTDGWCTPDASQECEDDTACEDGQICMNGACIDSCTDDPECGEGRYCNGGQCTVDTRPKPFCKEDSECEPGHPCVGGVCRTTCETHDQCLRFDVQFSFCKENLCVTGNEATSDCATNRHCEPGKVCLDGVCR